MTFIVFGFRLFFTALLRVVLFFFRLAVNQMMAFGTSLDPEREALPDRAWGTTCVH
jgi:hypothetical protein